MKRKIPAVICVAVLILTAGCGKVDYSPPPEETLAAQGQKTVIRAINWHTEREKAYELIAKSIENQYPDIEFVVENYNSNEYYSFLTVAVESGEAPELFTSHGSKTNKLAEYVNNGVCEPLDSYIDVSHYPNIMVERASVNGVLYMNPGAFYDTFPVYYNEDIFRENNLEEPKDYDEFIELCDRLVELGIVPFAYTAKDRWYSEFFNTALSSALIPDWCEDFTKGEARIDDERFQTLLLTVVEFGQRGYFGKDYLSIDGNGAKLMYNNGDAAMRIDGSWAIASYTREGQEDAALFYIPSKDGRTVINAGQDTCSGYSVYSRSPNKEDAIKVLQYLAQDEPMQIIADMTQSVIALETLEAKSPTLVKFTSYDHSIPLWVDYMFPMAVEGKSPSDTIVEAMQRMMYEGDSVDEAIGQIESVLDYP